MATTNNTIRSLVYASLVVVSIITSRVNGLAITSTQYLDSECTEPMFTVHMFGILDFTGNNTLGDFNECSTYGGGSSITVCDASTGEYGVSSYADAECCAEFIQESIFSQNCSAGAIGTTTTVRTEQCSNAEPSVISPSRVNFVVKEYNDNNCADPTGNTEILYGNSGSSCSNDGMNGSYWIQAECMAGGSYILQYFAPDDDACSSDVWSEGKVTATYMTNRCDTTEIEGLYYKNSVISCTTDSATLLATSGTLAPFTPAPAATDLTPAPSTDNNSVTMPNIITNAPSPVAKRDTVAPGTGAPARATIETPAPAASEEAVSFNTVAPATTNPDTFSPAATEATAAPDNNEAPTTSRVEAASGAARAKNTSVTAGAVAATCGLGLLVVAGRMRQ